MPTRDRASGHVVPPCALVIFGAAGDLTKRKLLPALYNLAREKLLPDDFAVIGVARADRDSESFREQIAGEIAGFVPGKFDPALWKSLESRLYYVAGEFGDVRTFDKLKAQLAEIEQRHKTRGNLLFYLATAPDFFAPIAAALREHGLADESDGHWRRLVVEKPFGRDLASAKALNASLLSVLTEKQIYRIDHYLGKETVQNILVFRFANGIFEPIWNRRYVDHVQITVSETLGVEKRGGYYDRAGCLRDMVPNHIFQLISLVGMEPPISFDADAVRDEQSKVLRAIRAPSPEDVLSSAVRGQYGAGGVGGRTLTDYRAEPGVPPTSTTETFVAMKLGIDSWRWNGVPFYLRVGKALAARTTEITIRFRKPPLVLFRDTAVDDIFPNDLVIHVQPKEGISLRFGAKIPGAQLKLGGVNMDFDYADHFGATPATGYERLLYDAMQGDQTLFQRADMVEASWAVVAPILDVWQALPPRGFPNYPAGSWGPKEAEQLLERDGRSWRTIQG
ncbi:MAG: glucose-6-phosphate dehydrogenase [Planctomycetes bacterium]|nr:glucose-6-phosphate dehydrogenase [Planctomycetota bacterium]